VVSDPHALALRLLESDHGERVGRPREPLYDELSCPVHQQIPMTRPQFVEVEEQEGMLPNVALRPSSYAILRHFMPSEPLLMLVDAVPGWELRGFLLKILSSKRLQIILQQPRPIAEPTHS
jgi:hypothetical protein